MPCVSTSHRTKLSNEKFPIFLAKFEKNFMRQHLNTNSTTISNGFYEYSVIFSIIKINFSEESPTGMFLFD